MAERKALNELSPSKFEDLQHASENFQERYLLSDEKVCI